jgi:ribonuclease R
MIPKAIKDREAILAFLKTKTDRPVSLREISISLRIPKSEARSLKRTLESLINSGDVYKTRIGLYGIAASMNLITGSFEAHRDGYGFVIPDKSGESDLFIPRRKTMGAMSGDRVTARVESIVKRDGAIIKILERGTKKIIGRLCHERNTYYVEPKAKNFPFAIYISPGNRAGAKSGSLVSVELTSYPTPVRGPEGKVVKVLPEVDEPRFEIQMIVEEHSLPKRFPPHVLKEAEEFPDAVHTRGRVDCRNLLTVTIDGEDAKDFDDAISISRTKDGFVLYVHIADVSHYVKWDSKIDLEARQRGTSVYFPGSVIPMLPERLSNNLCSLVPHKDRLTFTVELHINRSGTVTKKDFYPSVIKSNERMTYTSVKKILTDIDHHERRRYAYLLEDLEMMEELYNILKEKKISQGSLDFDLPEPDILLDIQGAPEAVIKAERYMSHMIIEEFMIAANEAVASHLESLDVPSIYRIHEKPDNAKLDELKPIFKALGYETKKSGGSAFRSILNKAKGTAEEYMLNILLLRSLKQAKYSTENVGHFGLASKSYTHFTSPIRRYPDLVVHRILKEVIGHKKLSENLREYLNKNLPMISSHSSQTERTAADAEREILMAMKAWFMKDKVGNEYDGIVTGINSQGLKIQLKDFFVEGFLHVSSMTDDYYRFDEERYRLIGRRGKKKFALGDEISVRVERIDVEERDISFGLA